MGKRNQASHAANSDGAKKIREIIHDLPSRLLGRYSEEGNGPDCIERWLIGKNIVIVHYFDTSVYVFSDTGEATSKWEDCESWLRKLAPAADAVSA